MKKFLLFIFLVSCISAIAFADSDIPEKPNPPRLVNDQAEIFTQSQTDALEKRLRRFNNSTSNQIVVLTVKSLKGYDPADFAFRVGEKWGVGQEGFNNGVVLLIKPKYGNERGQVYIAVGYGLEGVIPDAIANRIVEREMIPHFKNGDMYGGVEDGVEVLMGLAAKEFTHKEYREKINPAFPIGMGIAILLFIAFIILIKMSQARAYSAYHDVTFWQAMLLVIFASRSHPGKWKEFTSGTGRFGGGSSWSRGSSWSSGSSWGGGGGSSFGGFGGGSFGGGGAGGSW